ncbi:MAG: penicillin acylase family protein [Pirellulaceae bacterium]
MIRIVLRAYLALFFMWAATTTFAAKPIALPGLKGDVEVHYDGFGIPHLYAESWADACMVLGYLHASERLWEMDVFRRKASGRAAEVLGESELASDILVRQLGIRRGCEQILASDAVPDTMRAELDAYCAGVNARIGELARNGLPAMFQALGYAPAPWTSVDCIVFGKYMGWDQSGTDDDLWFGTIVEKLGVEAFQSLWPLDRPYEVPAVKVQVDRVHLSRATLAPVPGAASAYEATSRKLAAAGWYARSGSFGSNNWAVDGTKTASGKPILCSDPHLGFSLPSMWYTCHLSAEGRNVVGVTFPGSPMIVIGHNDRLAWGITNMQADSVDYYVETIHPDDPMRYRHRGVWKALTRITEKIPVRGEKPHTLAIDSTVHGPIVNREGRTISLAWTGLGGTTEMVGFWKMNRARNLREFLAAADKIIVPAINLAYADIDGNIAVHSCGALPLRLPGEGRIPMDGASGANDWSGMIARDELPLAVNPPDHFIASANGRPTSIGYPHYLGWMWDPSYRIRRIHEMLGAAGDLTVDTMKAIQNDVHDKAAERFLPALFASLQGAQFDDDYAKRAAEALKQWDYVATTDATGPIIWQSWLEQYRNMVWDDEWSSRGIAKKRGSWGYTGNNRREPVLEVFEFMTREHPGSIWFDDQTTPERETRDEIMMRAFAKAAAELKRRFGDEIASLEWGRINRLRIRSLTGQNALDREGGPVPGSGFTVNPGSHGGPVGGGASFRMIVDFGDVTKSVGVYPGGQDENPASPHYDDQIPLWSAGKYVSLHMIGDASQLPPDAKERLITFSPSP